MRIAIRVPAVAALLLAACGGDTPPRTLLAPSSNPTARAAAIAIVSGDNQQGNAGEQLGQPLVVRVTDAAGKGVGDAVMSFAVTGAGGLNGKNVAAPSSLVYSQTDPTGNAHVTLEPYEVGRILVTARVEGTQMAPVTFTADANVLTIEFRSPRSYGYYAAFYGPCRCVRTVNTVTVPVGTPVEWKSIDDEPYTVTSTSIPQGGIAFDSGTVTRNSRFRFVPSVIGTWEYHDRLSGLTAMLETK